MDLVYCWECSKPQSQPVTHGFVLRGRIGNDRKFMWNFPPLFYDLGETEARQQLSSKLESLVRQQLQLGCVLVLKWGLK